ncbi:MAG: STAS-like domain-containing protein [Methanospirillum sp.]
MEVRVADVAGEFAITPDDGQQVYDRIRSELREGRTVLLDFTGVKVVASPFLNMAVGQLLEDDPHGDIPDRIETRGLSAHDRNLLERVIANAREYYGNPVARRAIDGAIANAAEDL